MLSSSQKLFLLAGGVLVLLALLTSPQLNDDSYHHFQRSVEIIETQDWDAALTDLWNKPFPTLIYGSTGLLGIHMARLASVLLSLWTLGLLISFLRQQLLPLKSSTPQLEWAIAGAFLLQLSVLPQSYLTMTELIAAWLLMLGLYFLQKEKTYFAVFILGWMPLARVEMALIMTWLFLAVFVMRWSRSKRIDAFLRSVIQHGLLGSFPFILWWFLGFYITHDFLWIQSGSYAHWRPWSPEAWLQINVFTTLPGVLSAPLIFFCVLGFMSRPSHVSWLWKWILLGCVGIQGLFLSGFVVYPEGSRFGEHAIGAINSRNFNVIAPVLAMFIIWGWQSTISKSKFWGAVIVTQLSLLGFFAFEHAFGASWSKGVFKLGIQSFCLWGVLGVFYWKQEWRRKAYVFAGMSGIATVLSLPLFWYPLAFQDHRLQSQQELCAWLHQNPSSSKEQQLIIQDVNARLDRFCELSHTHAPWQWASFFQQYAYTSADDTLVVIETAAPQQAANRYSETFLTYLKQEWKLLHEYEPMREVSVLDEVIAKISSRNEPTGWQVYGKVSEELKEEEEGKAHH